MRVLAIILGMVFGLSAGLYYARAVSPATVAETSLPALRTEDKTELLRLIVAAYAVDGDVERARARVQSLGEADAAQAITALAQRTAAEGGDPAVVQAMAALATALGGIAGPVTPVAQPPTPEPTLEPTATPTLEPSPTAFVTATPILIGPRPTPAGVFQLLSTETLCLENAQPVLQVVAQEATGNGVPGVEVLVEWPGGQDRFFTGLQPEQGAGYGDFVMEPAVEYTVRLALAPDAGYPLRSDPCTDGTGNLRSTSVRLVFSVP
jgi:hypothetical protein